MEYTTDGTLLSAVIGGQELWYRFPPSIRVERPGDVLLAASLFPAMRRGEPIEIDRALAVSPRLLKAVQTIQDVFVLWNPMLQRIQVQAERIEEPKRAEEGAGAFFTGGVDGSYTLLKHAGEITHLVFVKGIDMQLDNET